MNAQVTISLSDLDSFRDRIKALELEVNTLKQDATKAEVSDPEVARLREAFDKALDVARFAVANLHPIGNPNWPWQSLRRLSELLPDIPGEKYPSELGLCLAERSRLAEKWTKAYADGTARDLLREENAAKSVTRGGVIGDAIEAGVVEHDGG